MTNASILNFGLTLTAVVLATSAVVPADQMREASQRMVADSRLEIASITENLNEIPREVREAGRELQTLWSVVSSKVAREVSVVKTQLQYETRSHS